MRNSNLARQIIDLLKTNTAKDLADYVAMGQEYSEERVRFTLISQLEILGDAMAIYLKETCGSLTAKDAINLTCLATLTPYIPASKYNGLFWDEWLADPNALGTWSDQLANWSTSEPPFDEQDAQLADYDFGYDVAVTGYHGAGTSR